MDDGWPREPPQHMTFYDLLWPQVGEEIYVCKICKRKNTTWDIMPPICIHIDIVSCFETLWSDDSHQASPDNAKRVSKATCPLWGMVSGLMLCHLDSQWTVVLCLPGSRIALLILLWKFSKYIPLASSSQTISKDKTCTMFVHFKLPPKNAWTGFPIIQMYYH